MRLLAVFLLTLAPLALSAAEWRSSSTETKKPIPGRNLQSAESPRGQYLFFLRKGEQGDFPWFYAYVQNDEKTVLLGSFNEVSGVTWSKDESTVKFRATKAIDFNKVKKLSVEFETSTGKLKTKVLKIETLEH